MGNSKLFTKLGEKGIRTGMKKSNNSFLEELNIWTSKNPFDAREANRPDEIDNLMKQQEQYQENMSRFTPINYSFTPTKTQSTWREEDINCNTRNFQKLTPTERAVSS